MNGTVNIHGKEYKTVALRITEFREKYPAWGIETEIFTINNESVIVKATVRNEEGKIISQGHAEEWRKSSMINKTSMVENCETSAVGRALAFSEFAGSEIASADEIEIARRKEEALQVHWSKNKETQKELKDLTDSGVLTKAEIYQVAGCIESLEEFKGTAKEFWDRINAYIDGKEKQK